MSINEITGDKLQSKVGNPSAFRKGWDLLFSNKSTERHAREEAEAARLKALQEKVSSCKEHATCFDSWVLGEPATEVKQNSGGCCGGCS